MGNYTLQIISTKIDDSIAQTAKRVTPAPRIRQCRRRFLRSVDASGKTVDFRLSPRRNVASAKACFRKAVHCQGRPPKAIALDGYAASHRAVRELLEQGRLAALTKLRSSKYLNNLIEQDHRNIKSRLGAMLGLKSFASAANTSRGVELMHRIHKGQFDLRSLATSRLCAMLVDWRSARLNELLIVRQN